MTEEMNRIAETMDHLPNTQALGSSDGADEGPSTALAPMILIVEDDPDIACSLAIRFKARGFRSCIAGDAIAAIGTAQEHEPDCAILDINVPGGNGFSVAEKLRSEPRTEGIPVVFLTASMLPEIKERAESFRHAGFMTKPYDAKELVALVQTLLEGSSDS